MSDLKAIDYINVFLFVQQNSRFQLAFFGLEIL
jgi:hypothetical protein